MNKALAVILSIACTIFPLTGALAQGQTQANIKPVIAVMPIEDIAKTGQGDSFSQMISTAVASTSKFRVMERQRLDRVLREQGLGGTITTAPKRIGGLQEVDYLIYGTITSVGVKEEKSINLLGLLSKDAPPCSNMVATLSVDIQITDMKTGEIKLVKRIDEQQKSAARCDGGAASVDTPRLLRSAADNIAGGLVTAIYPIVVAMVQPDGQLILNYGEGALQVGDLLKLKRSGKAVVYNGEVLGSQESDVGYATVSEVLAKMSLARMSYTADGEAVAQGIVAYVVPDAERKKTLSWIQNENKRQAKARKTRS
ncbi:CsgG/HfaB family protein [Sphingomonas hengshuiensis]|uniref:CsgG/HfaB family protein n=1 Tax=Sphingomonas hengshuiensis TaxID=1609977 RepID=UPI000981CE4F|nr:CsgG/HfaB family protein [Sphingomonas hengshuiensis]